MGRTKIGIADIGRLLEKVTPKIMAKPQIMKEYDINDRELSYIAKTNRLPLNVFLHVASNIFFFADAETLGITLKEARQLREYFGGVNPKGEIKCLKSYFHLSS